jgi:hypothetical protein
MPGFFSSSHFGSMKSNHFNEDDNFQQFLSGMDLLEQSLEILAKPKFKRVNFNQIE